MNRRESAHYSRAQYVRSEGCQQLRSLGLGERVLLHDERNEVRLRSEQVDEPDSVTQDGASAVDSTQQQQAAGRARPSSTQGNCRNGVRT